MQKAILFLFFSLFSGSVLSATEAEFLAEHGLAGKSVEQIIDAIDQNPQARPLGYSASVTGTALKLSSGNQSYTLPLGDKFYLSFAPYERQTHPCFNHSLSGCQGEMPNTLFNVKVTDKQGNVLINREMKSYQNGFVGVWLPRNIEGVIEVSRGGKVAAFPIQTASDSQTCLTSLQLRAAG